MPRTKGTLNKTLKYNVKINIMENDVLDKNFCSLKEIANELNIPFHTLTDIYEKRRTSFMRYSDCYYFPNLIICKLEVSAAQEADCL